MEEKHCALCQMKMWRQRQRKTEAQEPWQVWIKRPGCLEMGKGHVFLPLEMLLQPDPLVRTDPGGKIKPALIIGAPVGFVNVVQSKELILSLKDTPYIVAEGRKGGSNVAAAICNALLYGIC